VTEENNDPLSELSGALVDEISKLVSEEEVQQITAMVNLILPELAVASAAGITDLSLELEAQLKGLLELQKIRASKALWSVSRSVLRVAMRSMATGAALLRGGV